MGREDVTARFFIPLGESYGPQIVYVNATSQGNTSEWSNNLLLTVCVAQRYEVLLTSTDSWQKVADVTTSTDTITFNMTVKNLGNRRTDINLNITDIDGTGWSPVTLSPDSVTIDPEDDASVQLTIRVPEMEEAGDYVWSIKASSGPSTSSLGFLIEVGEVNDIMINSMSINYSISDFEPDGYIYIDLEVENIGNVETEARFTLHRPTGWDIFDVDPDPVTLAIGEKNTTKIWVRIANDAVSDVTFNITVDVLPDATSTVTDFNTVFFELNQTFGVNVSINGIDSRHADPGETVQFIVKVHNEGNGEDTIHIEVTDPLVDWDYEFSPSVNPLIDPFSSINLTFTVTSPDDASEDTYLVNFNATTGPGNTIYDNSQKVIVIIDQVYGLSLTSPTTQAVSEPNNTVEFYMNILNRGTGADTFEVEKINDTFPLSVTMVLENTTHDLNASEHGRSTVSIELPVKENIDVGSYEVSYRVTSDNGTQFDDTDDIVKMITFTVVVEPIYDLFIASGDVSKEAEPGETVSYSLDITNIGTGSSMFWLNKTGAMQSSASFTPTSISLDPSEHGTAYLNVTIPPWDDIPSSVQSQGWFEIGLRVSCLNDPSVTDEIKFNTTIRPQYDIAVSSVAPKPGYPGDTVYFNLSITNKGTHNDTFSTSFDNVPNDWDVDFQDPADAWIDLEPEESEIIGIEVTVSNDMDYATEGRHSFDYEIASYRMSDMIANGTIFVDVGQVHIVQLYTSGPEKECIPGDVFDFGIEVRNHGNANDTFLMNLQGDVADWGYIRSMPNGSGTVISSIQLASDEREYVYVRIQVPWDEDPGNYTLELNVSHDDGWKIVPLTITVQETYEVKIDAWDDSIPGDPGTLVTFVLQITNKGDALDNYTIVLTDEMAGWSFGGNSTDVYDLEFEDENRTTISTVENVGPDKIQRIYLTVPIPEKIGGLNIETGPHYINVTVGSVNDQSKTDSINLSIEVSEFYDFRVIGDERKEVDAGEFKDFIIMVENEGNANDTYGLQIVHNEGGDDWNVNLPGQVNVREGSFEIIEIEVYVPEEESSNEFGFTLRVRSQGDSDKYVDFNFTVKVNTFYDVGLSSPSDTMSGAFGENVTYQINVANLGNGQDTAHLLVTEGKLAAYTTFTYGNDTDNEIDVLLENESALHTVNVTLRIPDRDAINDIFGTDTMSFTALIIEGFSKEDEAKNDTLTLTVEFKAVYDFELIEVVDNIQINPNIIPREGNFEFNIRNDGTRADSYTWIKVEAPGGMAVDVAMPGSNLDPDSSHCVDVTVVLPEEENHIIPGDYDIIFEIWSNMDKDVAKQITLDMRITAFSLVFELVAITSSVNWDVGESLTDVELSFRIKNTGTRDDTYLVDVVNPPLSGMISLTNDYTGGTVESGKNHDVTVTISASGTKSDIKAGDHTITLEVTSEGNNSISERVDLVLRVEQFYDLNIKSVVDQDVTPGTPKQIGITVQNRGNGNDIVDIYIDDVDPTGAGNWLGLQRYAQGGLGEHYLTSVQIDWDMEVIVQLIVDISEEDALDVFDANDDRKVKISLQARAKDGSELDVAEEVLMILEELYRFEISEPEQDTKNMDDPTSSTPVTFRFNLENTGIAKDEYTFTYESNEFLDIDIDDPGEVGDEVVYIEVSVLVIEAIRYSEDEMYRLPSGAHDITLIVKSKGDSTQRESLTLTVVIGEKAYIELTNQATSDRKNVDPGDSVSYTLKLSNRGNTVDTITVSLTDPTFSVYGNLIYEGRFGTIKGKKLDITLDPGESDLINYNVTADMEDIREEDYDEFTEAIEAISMVESDVTAKVELFTQINQLRYRVDLDVPEIGTEVSPEEFEETAVLTANVQNDGDDPDDIEVRIRSVPEDVLAYNQMAGKLTWVELGWSGEGGEMQNGTTIVIEDMATGSTNKEKIYIFFDVGTDPSRAEAGEYVYNITAEATGGNPKDLGVLQYKYIYLTIEEVPGFELHVDLTEVTIDPSGEIADDTVTFDIGILNIGNFRDTYTIRTASAHSDIDIEYDGQSHRNINIYPDEEQAIQMKISVDDNTRMGTYDVILRVQSEKGLSQTETITVVVKAPDIRISKYDIRLDKKETSLREGDDISIEVRVWNNGTGPAQNVEVKFLVGGTVKGTETINIDEAWFKDITFDWEDIPAGDHSIRIITTGAQPMDVSVTKDVYVREKDSGEGAWSPDLNLDASSAGIFAGIIAGILIGLLVLLMVAGRPEKKQPKKPDKVLPGTTGGPIPPSRTTRKVPIEPIGPKVIRRPMVKSKGVVKVRSERMEPDQGLGSMEPSNEMGSVGAAVAIDDAPEPAEAAGEGPHLVREPPDVNDVPYPDDLGEMDEDISDWDDLMGMVDEVTTASAATKVRLRKKVPRPKRIKRRPPERTEDTEIIDDLL